MQCIWSCLRCRVLADCRVVQVELVRSCLKYALFRPLARSIPFCLLLPVERRAHATNSRRWWRHLSLGGRPCSWQKEQLDRARPLGLSQDLLALTKDRQERGWVPPRDLRQLEASIWRGGAGHCGVAQGAHAEFDNRLGTGGRGQLNISFSPHRCCALALGSGLRLADEGSHALRVFGGGRSGDERSGVWPAWGQNRFDLGPFVGRLSSSSLTTFNSARRGARPALAGAAQVAAGATESPHAEAAEGASVDDGHWRAVYALARGMS